jgi:hypothetical protein
MATLPADEPIIIGSPNSSQQTIQHAPAVRDFVRISPKVAIKYITAEDLFDETVGKVHRLLEAGLALVCVVFGKFDVIYSYTGTKTIRIFDQSDEAEYDQFLARYGLNLADLLREGRVVRFPS